MNAIHHEIPAGDPELFTRLQGAQGEVTRRDLLARLDELQARLQGARRTGLPHEEFVRLEAMLSAVENAKATLRAVKVGPAAR